MVGEVVVGVVVVVVFVVVDVVFVVVVEDVVVSVEVVVVLVGEDVDVGVEVVGVVVVLVGAGFWVAKYAAATITIMMITIAVMAAVLDNALVGEKTIFNLPSSPGLWYT